MHAHRQLLQEVDALMAADENAELEREEDAEEVSGRSRAGDGGEEAAAAAAMQTKDDDLDYDIGEMQQMKAGVSGDLDAEFVEDESGQVTDHAGQISNLYNGLSAKVRILLRATAFSLLRATAFCPRHWLFHAIFLSLCVGVFCLPGRSQEKAAGTLKISPLKIMWAFVVFVLELIHIPMLMSIRCLVCDA